MTRLRIILIWLVTLFFVAMMFLTLVREVLRRLTPPAELP